MKIILLGMVIIFLLGMTALLVVYTDMAHIRYDCRQKRMITGFVKNTILRYEECRKLGIKVDNVRGFVENIFSTSLLGGYSPDMLYKMALQSRKIIIITGILGAVFHAGDLQESFIYISMMVLQATALKILDNMTDFYNTKKDVIRMMESELIHFEKYSVLLKENVSCMYGGKLKGQAASEFVKLNKQYKQILKNT